MSRPICYADLKQIRPWFRAHNLPFGQDDMYPETGYIEDGVMAGFIYFTNSRMVFIENLISNPEASLRARWRAANEIADNLIKLASQMGYKYLCCSTNLRSVERLAKSRGFVFADQTRRYVMNLSPKE